LFVAIGIGGLWIDQSLTFVITRSGPWIGLQQIPNNGLRQPLTFRRVASSLFLPLNDLPCLERVDALPSCAKV